MPAGRVGSGTGALVRGIRAQDPAKLEPSRTTSARARLPVSIPAMASPSSLRMAENLGLIIGDTITLVAPEGDVTPFGTTPRVKAYPVVAIYEIGMSEYDATVIFMPLQEAQLYFNQEDRRSRSRYSSTIPTRGCAARPDRGCLGARRLSHRLAPAQSHLFLGARGRAQRHVHNPDHDRAGRCPQHQVPWA